VLVTRWVTLALCLTAAAATAADDAFVRGIDLVPITLTPTMNSGLTLDSAETRPVGSWQVGALVDFNFGLLTLKLGDQRLGDLVPFRATVHLMGAWQVHPRIELSADLPVTVAQLSNFQLLADQGFPQPAPAAAGFGALRALGRFQLLRQADFPIFSLAAIAEVRAPIGDTMGFLSDRGVVFSPRLALEHAFGPVHVVANGGWRLRTAAGRWLNLYVGQEFLLGGGVRVDLPDAWKLTQFQLLGELNVVTPAEAPFTFASSEALKTPFELMLGARAQVAEHWGVTLGLGKGLGESGYGREAFRLVLGLRYENVPLSDRDHDGIPDKVDQCPDEPEDFDGYQDEDGCPEPNPEPPPPLDTDGDGVPDKVDVCPTEPGVKELDGCPDRDGDQIPDNVDKCPDERGPAELQGCPPPPEEEPVVLESERIRIRNQVLYEFGSARIDPRSFELLDEVAKVLTTHPDVGPVVIEGHTDNIGPRSFNIDLSRKRAKAVEDYLVTKGIAPRRLRSDGFGFDRPLVPNDSALNRAKNRRTEFRLVDEIELPAHEGKSAPKTEEPPRATPRAAEPEAAPTPPRASEPTPDDGAAPPTAPKAVAPAPAPATSPSDLEAATPPEPDAGSRPAP
jgi:outer membrane protein OmpA-like peptidoglycan-associated protein